MSWIRTHVGLIGIAALVRRDVLGRVRAHRDGRVRAAAPVPARLRDGRRHGRAARAGGDGRDEGPLTGLPGGAQRPPCRPAASPPAASATNRRITRARRGPGLGAGGEDLLVGQRLAAVARPGVRDERDAADLEARPAGGDALEDRRHPDRVRAEGPEHPDLRRGLVLRPEQPGVDALGELDALGLAGGVEGRPEPRAPGVGQVLEPRPDLVGVRAEERRPAGQVQVVARSTISVPGPKAGSTPPAAFVRTTIPRAEPAEQQDRLDDQPRVVALVEVEPALEHHDRRARRAARGAAARRDPGAVAAGQPGSSANGMATASSRSSASPPSPEPSTIPTRGHEVATGPGPRPRGRRAGRAARAGGIGRGRSRTSRRDVGVTGVRASGDASRGKTAEARFEKARRTYRHRDAGRSPSGGRARAGTNEAAGSGQRSARSDRRGAEALDVISVSPVPDGPFGQDLRYGPASRRVNGVVHELRRIGGGEYPRVLHRCGRAWTSRGRGGRAPPQPPIANISIRGSVDDVASVRSSE